MQLSKRLLSHVAGGGTPTPSDLTAGLVSHHLLNNNADDNHGVYDGTVVGTVDFQGDLADCSGGSITIPSTGGVWCSYWKDTGTGMTHITSTTIPTSLATDNFSNLRIYNEIKDQAFIDELAAEGYYPKPLPMPTTVGLISVYELTGTAEDAHGTYDSTEVSATYIDDAEFGSVFSGTGSITINATAVSLATWCCYWVDTGSGWVFTKTTTIPSSLTTNKYRNLRLYNLTPSVALQDEIEAYEKNFRAIDIDDGLTTFYRLTKNSLDNYILQKNGTDTSVTYDGTWADYDGSTSYTNTGRSISINGSTVCFVARPNSLPSGEHYFFGGYNNFGDYSGLSVWLNGSTLYVKAGTSWQGTTTDLTIGNVYSIAVTVDGSTVKLYVDGVVAWSFSYSGTENSYQVYFGARNTGNYMGNPIDANLGRYRIYNKVLSEDRIAVISNLDKGVIAA